MHFLEWKWSNSASKFTETCSRVSNWQKIIIGSGKGLAPNRRQAITWTNDDPVHWRIYSVHGGDELNHRTNRSTTTQNGSATQRPTSLDSSRILELGRQCQAAIWLIYLWKITMPPQLLNTKFEWNRQTRLIQNHDWSQYSAFQSDAINTMNTTIYLQFKLFSHSLSLNYPRACFIHFYSHLSLIQILKHITGSVSTCTKIIQSCFSRLMEMMIGAFDYQVRWIAPYSGCIFLLYVTRIEIFHNPLTSLWLALFI